MAHWNPGTPGTFGRIGCPYPLFNMLGGYDEQLEAMGWQDVDFKRRGALVGYVEVVTHAFSGFSLPNDPANADLLSGKRVRHTKTDTEQKYKMQFTATASTLWSEQNTANRKLANKRGKKQAQVNKSKARLGSVTVLATAGSDRPGASAGSDRLGGPK